MKWGIRSVIFLASLWAALGIVWPVPIDLDSARYQSRSGISPGESLYKAELTQNNFGILGFRFFESSENRRNWEIRSKFAELNQKDSYAFLKGVAADFFGQDRGNVVHTVSDFGRTFLERNLVELEGNVKVVSRRGYEFKMQRLDYHGAEHRFHSDSPLTMRGPNIHEPTMFIEGVGMRGTLDNESFLIRKQVRARRKMSTSEWLNIQSETGEFFADQQRAVFQRKVKAQLPKVLVESQRFDLDTADGKELIVAMGNVTLKNRDRIGKAEKATIHVADDRIVLEGHAEIVTEDNRMQGEEILIFSQNDRVEVKAAQGSLRR